MTYFAADSWTLTVSTYHLSWLEMVGHHHHSLAVTRKDCILSISRWWWLLNPASYPQSTHWFYAECRCVEIIPNTHVVLFWLAPHWASEFQEHHLYCIKHLLKAPTDFFVTGMVILSLAYCCSKKLHPFSEVHVTSMVPCLPCWRLLSISMMTSAQEFSPTPTAEVSSQCLRFPTTNLTCIFYLMSFTGENAHRGAALGALLGASAANKGSGIPSKWKDGLNSAKEDIKKAVSQQIWRYHRGICAVMLCIKSAVESSRSFFMMVQLSFTRHPRKIIVFQNNRILITEVFLVPMLLISILN